MDGEAMDRLIGTTIAGRYRVKKLLGTGGAAHVLLCHHEELDLPVALKLLRGEAENQDNLYAHFVQEARLLARLHHPNIVRAFDFFRGRIDALVLEYIDGQSLGRVCMGQPMAWPRACRLALQCCDAVEALHRAGFVHRDLNPHNFMLQRETDDRGEQVKLIDLGTAKHLTGFAPLADALDHTTTLVPVTPAYMTPEFARSESRKGSQAGDTYGLVATLYAMLIGRAPFTTGNLERLVEQISSEPVRVPEDVALPPALRELLIRGLGKDATLRFATPAELAEALRAVLRPQLAAVTRPTPVEAQIEGGLAVVGEIGAVAAAVELVGRAGESSTATAAVVGSSTALGEVSRVGPRRNGQRPVLVGGAVAVALAAALTVLVTPARAVPLRLTSAETWERPAPSSVVLPEGPAPAGSAGEPEAAAHVEGGRSVGARPASEARSMLGAVRPASDAEVGPQVQRSLSRLRACSGSPRGPVWLEFDGGLQSINMTPVGSDSGDWPNCARRVLRRVKGKGRIDVQL